MHSQLPQWDPRQESNGYPLQWPWLPKQHDRAGTSSFPSAQKSGQFTVAWDWAWWGQAYQHQDAHRDDPSQLSRKEPHFAACGRCIMPLRVRRRDLSLGWCATCRLYSSARGSWWRCRHNFHRIVLHAAIQQEDNLWCIRASCETSFTGTLRAASIYLQAFEAWTSKMLK